MEKGQRTNAGTNETGAGPSVRLKREAGKRTLTSGLPPRTTGGSGDHGADDAPESIGAGRAMVGPGYGSPIPALDARETVDLAAAGMSDSAQTLPHLEAIQKSFGSHDVRSVEAHVGGLAANAAEALGAEAYASGDAVAFREEPDLHTAAHEAAHVVQQRSGVQLDGGVGQVGDRYEQQADAVADLVVAGLTAGDVLGSVADGKSSRGDAQMAVQRAEATALKKTPATKEPELDGTFSKASSFDALIELVIVAEQRLAIAGMASSAQDVVHVLRGIFYGTSWSMDNAHEGSEMRNIGFDYYTKKPRPDDPRPALGQSLFKALRESAEVKDPGGKATDFGHILAGLDSQTWAARTLPTGSGGTGLDIVTWLGDIGGGTGMLAMNRGGAMGAHDPKTSAYSKYNLKSDYGASVNIEGDIAGTVGIVIKPGQPLSEAMREYLKQKGDGASRYNERVRLHLEFLGGTVVDGKLTNEDQLIDKIGGQCKVFGTTYALTRLQSKNVGTPRSVRETGKHINGASREIATIYVRTLSSALSRPSASIKARSDMDPGVTPPAEAPTSEFEAFAAAREAARDLREGAREAVDWIKRQLDD